MKHRIIFLLVLFCSCYFDDNTQHKNKKNIVFVGDSMIMNHDWNTYIKHRCFMTGHTGYSTRMVIDLKIDFVSYDPDYIVVWVGWNDFKNDQTMEQMVTDYEDLLKSLPINKHEAKLICISNLGINSQKFWDTFGYQCGSRIYNINSRIVTFNYAIRGLCESYGGKFIEGRDKLFNANNELAPEYTIDGCHMNEIAYKIISDDINHSIK